MLFILLLVIVLCLILHHWFSILEIVAALFIGGVMAILAFALLTVPL